MRDAGMGGGEVRPVSPTRSIRSPDASGTSTRESDRIGDHLRLGLLSSWTSTRWPIETQNLPPLLELCRVIVAPSRGIGWLAHLPPGEGETSGPPGVIVAVGDGPGAAGLEPWPAGLGLAGLGLAGPGPAWEVAACEPQPAAVSSMAASVTARITGLVSMAYLLPGCGPTAVSRAIHSAPPIGRCLAGCGSVAAWLGQAVAAPALGACWGHWRAACGVRCGVRGQMRQW
jgi:hypothetical protein